MKLSLLIPTYNRPSQVFNLLSYLKEEIANVKTDDIEFEVIICDNSSNLETEKISLESELQKQGVLNYINNNGNIGGIENIVKLIELSSGEYSWVLGDDDVYYKGVLSKICNEINSSNFEFLFLNHCAYIKGLEDKSGFKSAVDADSEVVYEDGKELALKIWHKSKTALMFLSASVYKTRYLKESLTVGHRIDLAFPLFMAFYCASKGKSKLIKDICIDNIWGENSWENFRKNVFNIYVPDILKYLPKLGYNSVSVRKVYFLYLIPRFSSILKQKLRGLIKKKN